MSNGDPWLVFAADARRPLAGVCYRGVVDGAGYSALAFKALSERYAEG